MEQVGRKLEGRGAVEEDAATERAERRRRTDEETHGRIRTGMAQAAGGGRGGERGRTRAEVGREEKGRILLGERVGEGRREARGAGSRRREGREEEREKERKRALYTKLLGDATHGSLLSR